MARDFGKEIDSIKDQIDALQKMMESAFETKKADKNEHETVGHVQKMKDMHPNAHVSACLDEIENTAGVNGQTGAITYLGVFSSSGRQSTWAKHCVNTDDLLDLVTNNVAGKVLSCLGKKAEYFIAFNQLSLLSPKRS